MLRLLLLFLQHAELKDMASGLHRPVGKRFLLPAGAQALAACGSNLRPPPFPPHTCRKENMKDLLCIKAKYICHISSE